MYICIYTCIKYAYICVCNQQLRLSIVYEMITNRVSVKSQEKVFCNNDIGKTTEQKLTKVMFEICLRECSMINDTFGQGLCLSCHYS